MADLTPTTAPAQQSQPAPPAGAEPDLAALRAAIDNIDDAMHDLLMRRAALAAGMAAGRVKAGGPTFRPGREAAILRRLLARHEGPLPRPVVARLWRDIIASSLAQQGPFSMAACGAADGAAAHAARGHFGLLTRLTLHPTPAGALAAVAAGEATVAILPAAERGDRPAAAWWMQMEVPRLQVLAALPFLAGPEGARPEALAVAAFRPEPSGRDRTLLRFAGVNDVGRIGGALAALGLPPCRVIWHHAPAALAEVEGFLDPADPRLAALPFSSVQVLGAYAEPFCDAPARPTPTHPEEPPA